MSKKKNQEKPKNNTIVVFTIALIVTAALFFLLGRYVFPAKETKSKKTAENIDLPAVTPDFKDDGNLIRGKKQNYAVTIREYSNFFCGYCKKVQPAMKEVLDKYSGSVRHIFKYFPNMRIKNSLLAAKAHYAAVKQNKGEQIHDLLFTKRFANEDGLIDLAKEAGLNIARFKDDYNSKEAEEKINSDLNEARSLRFRGTPSFWIDGQRIVGAKPFDYWERIIKEKMKK